MLRGSTVVVTLLVALAALGVGAASAQQARPYHVVFVGSAPPPVERWDAFRATLRESGWMEGKDLSITVRAGPLERADELAREVIAKRADVIVAAYTAWGLALRRATTTIPVVLVGSGYPVEVGLAASMRRPGGNVTGNTIYGGVELFGKYLQLFHEVAPSMTRLGVLWDYAPPAFPDAQIALDELDRAARSKAVTLRVHLVRNAADLSGALAALASEQVHGLLVTSGFVNLPARERIVEFATRNRLPSMSDYRWPHPHPLLLVYSADPHELYRRAATFVDRILRGANAGDLPIEQPTKFELLINLRTAKSLGVTIPPALLFRADQLIE